MKKYLFSALVIMGLLLRAAAAADLGILPLSSSGEAADDAAILRLSQADSPAALTLRTPDGAVGSLTFDGAAYHFQPCGQTAVYTYTVLFSAEAEDAYGRPGTLWFAANADLSHCIFQPMTEWDAIRICSIPRWTDCGTLHLTEQGTLRSSADTLSRFFSLHSDPDKALSLTLRYAPGNTWLLTCRRGAYVLTDLDTHPIVQSRWTQLLPLPADSTRALTLTLLGPAGQQRDLLTYPVMPPYRGYRLDENDRLTVPLSVCI